MRSPAQIEASRRNGARSNGPKSRHNLALANSFTLDQESGNQFLLILENYLDYLQPLGPVETDLVETMAVCKWKQWRFLTAEKVTVDLEAQREPRSTPPYRNANAADIACALTRLQSAGGIKSLNVDSLSLDRQYHRSLNMLLKLQDRRPKSPSAPPPDPPVLPECDTEPPSSIFSGFSSSIPDPESVLTDFLGIRPEKNNPTTQDPLKTNAAAPLEPEEPEHSKAGLRPGRRAFARRACCP